MLAATIQPVEYTSLGSLPSEELLSAFNDAFSDYQVSVTMTPEKIARLMRARSVELGRSYGVVDGSRLVAFVLNGIRTIGGVLTAYDSGTGVRRRYQGRGLGRGLLAHSLGELAKFGCGRYVLEVLSENAGAIELYRKAGFHKTRTFHCYELAGDDVAWVSEDAPGARTGEGHSGVAAETIRPGWDRAVGHLRSSEPSWQNADAAVDAMGDTCRLLMYKKDGELAAYAVVETNAGNLMQVGVVPGEDWAGAAVIHAALAAAGSDKLRILNVDAEDQRLNEFLVSIGFKLTVSQFEMDYHFH